MRSPTIVSQTNKSIIKQNQDSVDDEFAHEYLSLPKLVAESENSNSASFVLMFGHVTDQLKPPELVWAVVAVFESLLQLCRFAQPLGRATVDPGLH